jgi:N-methylhydantoinase B/oxoprolinase/acetone carboxylase alpha subunit
MSGNIRVTMARIREIDAQIAADRKRSERLDKLFRRQDRKEKWPALYALEPYLRHPFLTLWCRWRLRHEKL